MPEPFVVRRLDVLLVDLVQQLGRDFPELAYGDVARCVDVVRRGVDEQLPVTAVVTAVEVAVREDLVRLRDAAEAESV